MNMNSAREQLRDEFRNKEYRDAFVAEHIYGRLPAKIFALREARGLSQRELGDKIGVAQTWVSKLEDPNYGKLTLSTLLRIASAFDVGIEVDFVPFSKVLDDAVGLSSESWKVASFAEDLGAKKSEAKPVQMPVGGSKMLRQRGGNGRSTRSANLRANSRRNRVRRALER